jgi:hypothetical protein
MLTQELLKSLFSYDPATGNLIRIKNSGTAKAGEVAGFVNDKGYVVIKVKSNAYKAHRLVWLYHYGILPIDQIDHANSIKHDNRIENLRNSNNGQNRYNTRLGKNNTSGIKGLVLDKRSNKWSARINVNGKRIHLGLFDNKELAELVVTEAREKYHKEFANHGI